MKTRPLKPREEVAPHGASTLLTVLADAPPTMKDKWPHEPDAHDIALDVSFLRILRHVYYGTRWETVEPHAARATRMPRSTLGHGSKSATSSRVSGQRGS